jgi:hypothetical protein
LATREYLQAIIEEQETTNEELKAANEEALSNNEELQSTGFQLRVTRLLGRAALSFGTRQVLVDNQTISLESYLITLWTTCSNPRPARPGSSKGGAPLRLEGRNGCKR